MALVLQYTPVFLGIFLALIPRAICDPVSGVSITSVLAYQEQRPCVQNCIWREDDHISNLNGYLGCPSPVANSCWCRDALTLYALSFLTSCVNQFCNSVSTDVSQAVSVYTEYCSQVAPAKNEATPTVDNKEPTSTVRVFVTVTSSSTPVGGAVSQALSESLQDLIFIKTALCLLFFGLHWS